MSVSRILIIAAITALPCATSATAQTANCRFDEGAMGEARCAYFSSRSGTATGKGWANRNEKAAVLGGHNVLPYVFANEGETKDLTDV